MKIFLGPVRCQGCGRPVIYAERGKWRKKFRCWRNPNGRRHFCADTYGPLRKAVD